MATPSSPTRCATMEAGAGARVSNLEGEAKFGRSGRDGIASPARWKDTIITAETTSITSTVTFSLVAAIHTATTDTTTTSGRSTLARNGYMSPQRVKGHLPSPTSPAPQISGTSAARWRVELGRKLESSKGSSSHEARRLQYPLIKEYTLNYSRILQEYTLNYSRIPNMIYGIFLNYEYSSLWVSRALAGLGGLGLCGWGFHVCKV